MTVKFLGVDLKFKDQISFFTVCLLNLVSFQFMQLKINDEYDGIDYP